MHTYITSDQTDYKIIRGIGEHFHVDCTPSANGINPPTVHYQGDIEGPKCTFQTKGRKS